jgi:hypothetical protein
LRSPQTQEEYFSHLLCLTSCCMLTSVSAHKRHVLLEIKDSYLPVRSDKAFKINFEVPINKRHSIGLCCRTRASMKEPTSLHYTKLTFCGKNYKTVAEKLYVSAFFKKTPKFQSNCQRYRLIFQKFK